MRGLGTGLGFARHRNARVPTIYNKRGDTALTGNQVQGFAAAATDLDARLTALGA